MEYSLKKENCSVCETILQSSSEQPVDLDFSLPDYCPDIERILKCRMCPSITSKSITGNRLDVDGVTVIRLYYLDSKKQAIRCCEHSSPFACSFELKSTSSDMAANVRVKTEYLNCRAVSPRRLDIHGAFTVTASVYSKGNQEYCTDIEGDDIQQRKHEETVSNLCGIGQQQFSISEVLDIGQGKDSPESILRSELNINLDESRAIEDKLMLKGEAVLRVLYVTDIETGAQDFMSFNIPFSQVIDVPGITESTVNDISVDVMSTDVSLKSEFDANSTLIALDARLSALVFAYEPMSVDLIEDTYSTAYELELECKNVPVRRLIANTDMKSSVKEEINTGDSGITKVIDLWCDGINFITAVENNMLTVRGKLNCCMLALDKDGIPFCAEKAVDFSLTPDMAECPQSVTANTSVTVPNISFRITGDNTVEIKADLSMRCSAYESTTRRCITSANALEDRMRKKDSTAALTLYYADEGESLWNIAQLYCTSVEAIQLENNITDDVIQARGMVLIPM